VSVSRCAVPQRVIKAISGATSLVHEQEKLLRDFRIYISIDRVKGGFLPCVYWIWMDKSSQYLQ